MINDILNLSKKLISIKSTANNSEALDEVLNTALSGLNDFTIERFENNGAKSALIYNLKKRPSKFKVILNGHLDVVPGKDHLYSPDIKGDKLYGIGSMDMKSSAVCLIMVFKDVADKVDYPLALQLVTDEEIGGFNGTKYQIDQGVKADFVITGESTGLQIANRAKGILHLKISTKGKTAHGAYPWRGENAIWKMNLFLDALKKQYPIPSQQEWITTVNLSRIETSNQSFNKIPDDCEVWLDIRFIPEDADSIVSNIKSLLPKDFNMSIIANEPAMFVDERNQYLIKLQQIGEEITKDKVHFYGAQGSSDARHYKRVGIAGAEFGPIGENIGSDKECVSIKSLEKYTEILRKFLLSI